MSSSYDGRIGIMFFDGCVNPALSDSLSPESDMPEIKPAEFCDISNQSAWGYLNNQKREYFPESRFLGLLTQCRAWGGNFLLNFGPDPDEDLPPEAYNTIRGNR
jgi:hypothetical protein